MHSLQGNSISTEQYSSMGFIKGVVYFGKQLICCLAETLMRRLRPLCVLILKLQEMGILDQFKDREGGGQPVHKPMPPLPPSLQQRVKGLRQRGQLHSQAPKLLHNITLLRLQRLCRCHMEIATTVICQGQADIKQGQRKRYDKQHRSPALDTLIVDSEHMFTKPSPLPTLCSPRVQLTTVERTGREDGGCRAVLSV